MLRSKRSQSGSSLIEMMIAMLILAIGLLGQMALQMNSLRANQSSYSRSQAVFVANDIADRMRLNPAAVSAGNYNAINTATGSYSDQACSANGCSVTEQANQDMFEWQQDVNTIFPSATATVIRDASVTDQPVFLVTIAWASSTHKDLQAETPFTMEVGL